MSPSLAAERLVVVVVVVVERRRGGGDGEVGAGETSEGAAGNAFGRWVR